MKGKKMALMLVVALSIMVLLTTNAIGAAAWYNCTVDWVGPGGSHMYIKLTDTASTPAFVAKWFELPPEFKKELLAVGLTAMTTDMTVRIRADASLNYPILLTMYLIK